MIRVFRHALVFGLAPVLQKLVGLVLLPLYTRYLTAADYGEIELIGIALGLLGLVLKAEIRNGYMRAWLDAPDPAARAALFRAVLRGLALAGGLGAVLVLLLANPVGAPLVGHGFAWAERAVLAAWLFADVVSLVCQATLQARLDSARMVALGLLQFALSAVVTAVGVVGLGMGPIAFFAGGAVGTAAMLAAMLASLRPVWRVPGGAAPDLRGLLAYSLPLLGGGLLFFVVRNADRLALSRFGSVAELGLYAMAWTLAGLLLNMVFTPILTAFEVWRFEVYRDGGRSADMARFFRTGLAVLGVAAVGLCSFGADAFVRAADPRFAPALVWLPWLCTAVLMQAGYSFLAAPFHVTGATGRWLRLFAMAAAVQVALSVVLVPVWGIGGATASILCANLALYVGAARGGPALWSVAWPHRAAFTVIVGALACALLRRWLAPATLPAALLADAAVCALFAALLLAGGIVRLGDVALLRRMRPRPA